MRTAGTGTPLQLSHDEVQKMAHKVVPLERCHFCTYDDAGDYVASYCPHHVKNPDPFIERPKPADPSEVDRLRAEIAALEAEVLGDGAPASSSAEAPKMDELEALKAELAELEKGRTTDRPPPGSEEQ